MAWYELLKTPYMTRVIRFFFIGCFWLLRQNIWWRLRSFSFSSIWRYIFVISPDKAMRWRRNWISISVGLLFWTNQEAIVETSSVRCFADSLKTALHFVVVELDFQTVGCGITKCFSVADYGRFQALVLNVLSQSSLERILCIEFGHLRFVKACFHCPKIVEGFSRWFSNVEQPFLTVWIKNGVMLVNWYSNFRPSILAKCCCHSD